MEKGADALHKLTRVNHFLQMRYFYLNAAK